MNSLKTITINWNDPDVLNFIIQKIKRPLDSIISVSKTCANNDTVIKNSREINIIVEQILRDIQSKSIRIIHHSSPEIFGIYESNVNVQNICTNKIIQKKISIEEQTWLVELEKEIYKCITKNDLNICDLSHKMAVSERQLYRKITNLIYLTPNKYIRILKLHKAKQIIDQNLQNSISQIAYAVGYSDVNYFSKLFAHQYNITPKELILSQK